MAIKKRPYELSIWIERLNDQGIKEEIKGAIIGAHDMNYLGKATNVVLKREVKGTNTLTFQMVDTFFDSLVGDYVKNEFIDDLIPERKLKLFYKNEWFELFIKKINEKKVLKGCIKTFTCTDAFIDELSRNGYGLTFDEDLYNNVEEIGDFTIEVLDGSLWHYYPEYNWGDFSEFTEERLYKIPISQFGGIVRGHKLKFEIVNSQRDSLKIKEIKNIYTGESRAIELSDDIANNLFWDQQNLEDVNGDCENPLLGEFLDNIENDGYIYVPYSCLNFCYGSEDGPDKNIKYDRAATENALKDNNKFVISPQSVNPNTIIQFLAIPKNAKIEIDEEGVILNREYHYFMTLREWNESIVENKWYFFEDTRLVNAETLGAEDLVGATISHTFRYLYNAGQEKILDTYKESYGNKYVYYDGYLNDENEETLMGRKYSIADRTEINITEEIDQYVVVYNNSPDEYKGFDEDLYSSNDWNYTIGDNKYRVCSKIETRQVIPQMARNLIQNGINIQSIDGWSPMRYTNTEESIATGQISLRTIATNDEEDQFKNQVKGTVLYYQPPHKDLAYIWEGELDEQEITLYQINGDFYTKAESGDRFNLYSSKNSSNYKTIKMNLKQKKDENTGKYIVFKVYCNNENKIAWYIDDTVHETQLEKEDFNILNFGLIGQNKTLEKDKIYCIGIELLLEAKQDEDDFNICIGSGSLISTGDYGFSNKIVKITKEQLFGEEFIGAEDFDWNSLDDVDWTIPYVFLKQGYLLFRMPENIENPYFSIELKNKAIIKTIEFFEAYTKGQDSFSLIDAPYYRYSGRDLFGVEQPQEHTNESWRIYNGDEDNFEYYYSYPFISTIDEGIQKNEIKERVLFEDMIMLGSTYEYQNYFIQRLKAQPNDGDPEFYDTCGVKEFISSENLEEGKLPLDAAKYTEDNYVIETNYINMNKCKYYNANAVATQCDCNFGSLTGAKKTCYYQKFGYCPYRFQTEKHPRKIRTLKISKSNRFNIIQEISKVFETYPQFYINHNENGHIVKNEDNEYEKCVFFITEKGMENKIGFRYEKNLKDISRDLDSDKIVTKLYVDDVDSELSKTGLCSIKAAEDNISKDSFIIDFSYYTQKGLLDKDEVEKDLYGDYITRDGQVNQKGYLRQLGYYNERYDEITNKIINLQDMSFTELEANLNVNLEGITTAQEQLNKIKQQMEHFNSISYGTESQSYLSYKTKKEEQEAILLQLIYDTFYSDGLPETDSRFYNEKYGTKKIEEIDIHNPNSWFLQIVDYDKMKETWVNQHIYTKGILGQYNKEYNQIQAWKKERASYLKMINKISDEFYKKYEPYLKEGTWSDSNYLNDNAYYLGALQVSAQGAIPKVSYNISVIGLDIFEEYEDIYNFNLADTTWVEDEALFGTNQKTGMPNKLKVLISEITYNLDEPMKDSIKIQNYTTKFEDLFQQITASVQSLQYNENIYKRSSNFTSLQNIETSSLQGTLDQNNLTLIDTEEANIQLDNEGTRGSNINNHANKYKQNGQGIYFSNDGGQHWSTGVGPSGINADYIKVGSLDASKIRIVDGNYVYFNWNKDGIVAYRDPVGINTTEENADDFSCFNKYGLSVCSEGQIKLRSGYSFNGEDGKFNTEQEAGDNIGFYLYNDIGKEIFAAEAVQGEDSSQINLYGEMKVVEPYDNINGKNYLWQYKTIQQLGCLDIYTDYGIVISPENWDFPSSKDPRSCVYEKMEKLNNYPYRIFIDGNIGGFDGYYHYPEEKRGLCNLYKFINLIMDDVLYPVYYFIIRDDIKNGVGFYCIDNKIEDKIKEDYYTGFKKRTTGITNFGADRAYDYYKFYSNKNYVNSKIIENQQGYLLYISDKLQRFYFYKEPTPINSKTVCYINNKSATGNAVIKQGRRRIFSVIKNDDNDQEKIINIFTVFNDGDIYIGGKIDQITRTNSDGETTETLTVDNLPETFTVSGFPIHFKAKEDMSDFFVKLKALLGV